MADATFDNLTVSQQSNLNNASVAGDLTVGDDLSVYGTIAGQDMSLNGPAAIAGTVSAGGADVSGPTVLRNGLEVWEGPTTYRQLWKNTAGQWVFGVVPVFNLGFEVPNGHTIATSGLGSFGRVWAGGVVIENQNVTTDGTVTTRSPSSVSGGFLQMRAYDNFGNHIRSRNYADTADRPLQISASLLDVKTNIWATGLYSSGPIQSSNGGVYGSFGTSTPGNQRGIEMAYDPSGDRGRIATLHQNVSWKRLDLLASGIKMMERVGIGMEASPANNRLSVAAVYDAVPYRTIVAWNAAQTVEQFYVGSASGNTADGFLRASSWTYSSDERLKEDIEPETDGLEKLARVAPIRYRYKEDKAVRRGFSAQQLREVFPEMVVELDSGELGIRTNELLPVLLNAVVELSRQVEALRK